MFDPKKIFPEVRKIVPKGTDEQVMAALTKLAQAHPDLNEAQALQVLQEFQKKHQTKKPNVQQYLGGE